MTAYILSYKDLHIKDLLEYEDYEFNTDIEYSSKSSLKTARKPEVENDDFIVCRDNNKIVFTGICTDYGGDDSDNSYTITLLQKECIFDREIFLSDEEIKKNVGIEDFIVHTINKYFKSSGDKLLDKSYINAVALSHTKVYAGVPNITNTEKGIYNFKTFLGNIRQYYKVQMDFRFENSKLIINIYKDSSEVIPIDISVSEVAEYKETYDIDVLSRLQVKWKIPDKEVSGVIEKGKEEYVTYYLLEDRSIGTDINSPKRVSGSSKAIYIECETREEMHEQAMNAFSGNRYNHKVSFKLRKNSRLYPLSSYYIGRECRFKSRSGIKESMITSLTISSDDAFALLTFGNLKVKLTEKIRRN